MEGFLSPDWVLIDTSLFLQMALWSGQNLAQSYRMQCRASSSINVLSSKFICFLLCTPAPLLHLYKVSEQVQYLYTDGYLIELQISS